MLFGVVHDTAREFQIRSGMAHKLAVLITK
jgi:hypothetical protein